MNNTHTYSDVEEFNIDDTEMYDISQIIKQKHRLKKNGISENNNQPTQRRTEDSEQELQINFQTQNYTTQTEFIPTNASIKETEIKGVTFRCADKKFNKQTIKHSNKKKTEISTCNTCRVCGEGTSNQFPLIKACKCVRSRYFVHEECLKQQILDEFEYKIRNAKCFHCQTAYNMIIESKYLFLPKLGWQKSQDKLPLVCLVIFQVTLIIIVILLGIRLSIIDSQNTTRTQQLLDSPIFIYLFFIISLIISIILIWLIIMILKNIFYVENITKWTILPYIKKNKTFKMEQNIDIDKLGKLHFINLKDQEQQILEQNMTKSVYIGNQSQFFRSQKFNSSIA